MAYPGGAPVTIVGGQAGGKSAGTVDNPLVVTGGGGGSTSGTAYTGTPPAKSNGASANNTYDANNALRVVNQAPDGTLIDPNAPAAITSTQLPATLGAKTLANSVSVAWATDATLPTGSNIIGRVGIDQTTPGTTNAVAVKGMYNTPSPVLTNGQRTDLQANVNGLLITTAAAQIGGGDNQVLNNIVGLLNFSGSTPGLTAGINYLQNSAGTGDKQRIPSQTRRLLSSAATTNLTSATSAYTVIFKIVGNNTVASKRYLKIYDKGSPPVLASDVPIEVFVLLPNQAFDFNLLGFRLASGLAYAITGGLADTDTTAIGAGDIEALHFVISL